MRNDSLERLSFEVLALVRVRGGTERPCVVRGPAIAERLGIPLEQLYFSIELLARESLVDYLGAGPKVRLTPAGLHRLETAGRRRSVRQTLQTATITPKDNVNSDR